MKKGRAGTMTHDYKRHGTTTLFAALDVLEGKVIGRCMQRHRHQEFIRFLNAIEKSVPTKKSVHVILDNYAAHKHPKVIAWLSRHPRVTFHFTPTSASWLNAVEGFFAALTKRRLKRGAFVGVVDLQAAINRYVADHNADPKPFRWKANPDKIIAAAARGHQTLDSIQLWDAGTRHQAIVAGPGHTDRDTMTDKNFTIFLVDDDSGVRTALSGLLRARRYEVKPYPSPQDFLADHDATVPGCALLDVSMPGLDGLALQEALTADGVHRPVIFITGVGDVPTSVRAMKAGAIDFLTKPVDESDLLAAIERAAKRDAEARQSHTEVEFNFRRGSEP